MDWKYRLEFEFPVHKHDGSRFLRRCLELEGWMRGALGKRIRADVQGHEFRGNEHCIVVFSDDAPEHTLRRLHSVIEERAPRPDWRMRYRALHDDEWTTAWRKDGGVKTGADTVTAGRKDEWSEETGWAYQLVVQFPRAGADSKRFDELIELEEQIDVALAAQTIAELDGHDAGSGEFNLFIFCNAPRAVFDDIRPLIERVAPPADFRTAYRSLDDDDEGTYHVLWPPDLAAFDLA